MPAPETVFPDGAASVDEESLVPVLFDLLCKVGELLVSEIDFCRVVVDEVIDLHSEILLFVLSGVFCGRCLFVVVQLCYGPDDCKYNDNDKPDLAGEPWVCISRQVSNSCDVKAGEKAA